MSNLPYIINLLSTVAVFCGCTWQLALLQRMGGRKRDYAQWLLFAVCFGAVAVGMLGIFLRDIERHAYIVPWYVLLLRAGLTVLFVYPWRRRETDR